MSSALPRANQTVGDMGERALIARIRAAVPKPPASVLIGIGDDAAVLEPARNELEVVTTDALVEGVHFSRALMSDADIGYRALAVNVSDLAAMGARPRTALLSLSLPDTLALEAFDGFLEGFLELARAEGISLVGGNITRTPGPWSIDVTVMGSVRRRRVLTRAGAKAGHELYVTGVVGAAATGLRWLSEGPTSSARTVDDTVPDDVAACVARYRRPTPRSRLGRLAGQARAASACMDLSDGLADAVTQVARASGTGATVDADALPVSAASARLYGLEGARDLALGGGDDYELLFAVPPKRRRAFLAAMRHREGVPVTRIGVLEKDDHLRVRGLGVDMALPTGYAHFRPS